MHVREQLLAQLLGFRLTQGGDLDDRRSAAGEFLVSKTIQVTMNGLATALRNAG